MLQKCSIELILGFQTKLVLIALFNPRVLQTGIRPEITFNLEPPSIRGQQREDLGEPGLSDDEDLSPDQPTFIGLFKPQVFRSLLHKAKLTTGLGLPAPKSSPLGDIAGPSSSLFEEPTHEAEEIPGLKLFRDVVTRQWSAPV